MMESKELFALGLGISQPWYIEEVILIDKKGKKELHIYLEHTKDIKFRYEDQD